MTGFHLWREEKRGILRGLIWTKKTAKVFGIGWAKTGTTTLGVCLKRLGYVHQSQNRDAMRHYRDGNAQAILKMSRRRQSFEDWPWLLLYKEFDAAYPGSKFILTERDTAAWLRSYRSMLQRQGPPSSEVVALRSALYGLEFPDVTDQELCERYEQHNRDVKAYFDGRPDDLLIVDWAKGDDWRQLCQFLHKPVPDDPFPHANSAPANSDQPLGTQVRTRRHG